MGHVGWGREMDIAELLHENWDKRVVEWSRRIVDLRKKKDEFIGKHIL